MMPELLPALTAADAAAASIPYDEVRTARGCVWWLQGVPQEGGRLALMRMGDGKTAQEVTAAGVGVGSDLHGYGGGAYAVDDSRTWYVDATTGHVAMIDEAGAAHTVAERRQADEHYGDLAVGEGYLWCVRETCTGDELLRIAPDGTQRVMAATDGFFGSPRPHRGKVAWLQWDADRMPWDGTVLMIAESQGATLRHVQRVAGGRQESVTQPDWDAQGRLWFLSDRTGWWNLYNIEGGKVVAVAPMEVDLAPPEWEAGYRSFTTLRDSGAIMIAHHGFRHRLLFCDGLSVKPRATPFTSFKPYLAQQDNKLFGIAASATQGPSLFCLDVDDGDVPVHLFEKAAQSPGVSISQPQ